MVGLTVELKPGFQIPLVSEQEILTEGCSVQCTITNACFSYCLSPCWLIANILRHEQFICPNVGDIKSSQKSHLHSCTAVDGNEFLMTLCLKLYCEGSL